MLTLECPGVAQGGYKAPAGGWRMVDGVQKFMADSRVISDFRGKATDMRSELTTRRGTFSSAR